MLTAFCFARLRVCLMLANRLAKIACFETATHTHSQQQATHPHNSGSAVRHLTCLDHLLSGTASVVSNL